MTVLEGLLACLLFALAVGDGCRAKRHKSKRGGFRDGAERSRLRVVLSANRLLKNYS